CITIYRWSSDTFTKLSDPSILPAGIGHEVAFDSTGTYLAVAHTGGSYITIYKQSSIESTDTPIIDILLSGTYSIDEARIEAWGYIYRAVTADGSITFYATEKPTVSLPIQIKVVR